MLNIEQGRDEGYFT